MTSEKISSTVQLVHESVAFEIADNYLANLAKNTDNTFSTLDFYINAFRYEFAHRVHRKAKVYRVNNMKFRDTLLSSLARAEIRRRLEKSPTLASKLIAIRKVQEAKERAEAEAESATWKPLPVALAS